LQDELIALKVEELILISDMATLDLTLHFLMKKIESVHYS